jgi:hypothetical protein
MRDTRFRFEFAADVDVAEAQGTLGLSLLAAEGLHGDAKVRTDVAYSVDAVRSEIHVSGRGVTLDHVVQIFTSLLTHEFGREAFRVRASRRPSPRRLPRDSRTPPRPPWPGRVHPRHLARRP